MPLPFILAGLAALGSAAAGTAAAVGTAATAAGAAAAGTAAAVGAAATAAGAAAAGTVAAAGTAALAAAGTAAATVGAAAAGVVGAAAAAGTAATAALGVATGIVGTASAALGAGTIIVGTGMTVGKVLFTAAVVFTRFVLTDQVKKLLENAQTEGFKEGYANASREDEDKFQAQAKLFLKEMEETQKKISQLEDREAKQREIAKELYRLLGRAVGTITGFEAKGETAHEDTIELCAILERLVEDLNKNVA